MPNKQIITGQHVPPKQVEHSKELRREMTPAESKLWQRLRAGRLLVVEVDGGVHLEQVGYDRERDAHFRDRGLKVLRFTNTHVNQQIEAVLMSILEACQEAGGESS